MRDEGSAKNDSLPSRGDDQPERRRGRLARRLRLSLVLLLLVPVLANCRFSAPGYDGPVSDHFDGEVFFNRHARFSKGLSDVLRWRVLGDRVPWPETVPAEPRELPRSEFLRAKLAATFINHATVLLRINGVTILTDPIYSERCSPVSFAGPKRVRPPGIRFDALPTIDVVVISHNHYDHLDVPTLRRLAQRDGPIILAGLGTRAQLERDGVPGSRDLDWGEELRHKGLGFRFVDCQHWSSRGLTDRRNTLWGSWILEGARADGSKRQVYFAGDTGYSPHFKEQGERYGPFDLALLPIGAYEPRWFMAFAHMNPADAVKAHIDLRSKLSMGIHFGTFQLTDEGIDAPLRALAEARRAAGLSELEFRAPKFGETWILEPGSGAPPGGAPAALGPASAGDGSDG